MANGLLGKVVTTADTHTAVYTVPATGIQFATVFVCAVNTGAEAATLDVAVSTDASPANSEYVSYAIPLDANGGVYEYPCIILHPGEKLFARSNKSTVVVRVHGLEQVA